MISFNKSRFKGKTISKRMNTAQALLVMLLLLGAGLVVWSEHIRSDSAKNSENLTRAKDRIFFNMVRMSDSMRGLLLDFANTQERRNFDEAEKDMFSNADAVHNNVYRDYSDMLKSLEKLINFNRKELSPYYLQLLTQMAANPGAASANYQTNFPAISSQRQKLYLDFSREVSTVIAMEAAQTSVVTAVMGFGAIAIVLIGSLMIGRFQSSAVAGPLGQLVAGIERMRGGDFTQRLELNRQDEFGILSDGFNRLADDLSTIVGQVQRAGGQVNTNAARIADIARGQQVTANEIASTTVWIGGTSKEISTTSRQLVKTMSEVTAVSEETARLAGSGQAAITRMETTMRQIMDASSAITTKLAVLSEKTGNINTVVTTITKVADQTNLLSLNAAIEAEKAGEYGLGFSVVATEIRRLADQTAVATYDIEKMVKEMQSAVTGGVMGMEKFSDEVRLGVEEIRRVSTQLAQIIQQVQTLNPRFQVVNEGMQSQASGAQQINETLVELGDSAQKTADSLRQSNLAIEQLNEAAHGLQNSVARFKLKS